MNINDIKKFCAIDPLRENISAPFWTEIDGAIYVIATDGRWLIAIQSDKETVGDLRREKMADRIVSSALKMEPTEQVTDCATLAAWAGESRFPQKEQCRFCEGTGHCKCAQCSDEEYGCLDCDDDGFLFVGEPRQRAGFIHGTCVDMDRLAAILTVAAAPFDLHVAGKLEAVEMRGKGWIAVVMPLASDPMQQENPPVWPIGSVAVPGLGELAAVSK